MRRNKRDQVLKIIKTCILGFKWLTPQDANAMFQPGTTAQSLIFNAEDVSSLMLKEKLIAKQLPPITELIDDRFLKQTINQ